MLVLCSSPVYLCNIDLLFGLFNESNSERDVGINTVEYSFYQYIGRYFIDVFSHEI